MHKKMFQFNRIFCIGRNYINHARELNNERPNVPVLFMKPASCIVHPDTATLPLPPMGYDAHYEAELVLLNGKTGHFKDGDNIDEFIHGYTLGLDLTLRQLQNDLKGKGLPWEKSKAFDNSSPLGTIMPIKACKAIDNLEFDCFVNNEKRQHGNVRDMIFSFEKILREISNYWQLLPGDLIYTGTPEGVGVLHPGDLIRIASKQTGSFEWKIAERMI